MASSLGVDPQLVWQWTTGVRRVPAERCPAIERLTQGQVRCEDLRPDVEWAVLRHSTTPAHEDSATAQARGDETQAEQQEVNNG